jgi:DNA-binding transcriptional LysR family regulator
MLAATREVLRSAGTRKRPLDREALERVPAVTTRATARWRFVSDGDVHEVRPNARVVVNDPRIAVDAASRGLGMVVAPRELVAASPRRVPVATTRGEPEPRDVFLVQATRKLLPSRTRAFVAWATAPGRARER